MGIDHVQIVIALSDYAGFEIARGGIGHIFDLRRILERHADAGALPIVAQLPVDIMDWRFGGQRIGPGVGLAFGIDPSQRVRGQLLPAVNVGAAAARCPQIEPVGTLQRRTPNDQGFVTGNADDEILGKSGQYRQRCNRRHGDP